MLDIDSSSLLGILLKLENEISNPDVGSVVNICGEYQQIFWSTNFQMKKGTYTSICTRSSPHIHVNEIK